MRNNFQKLSLILSAVFFLAVAAVFVFLYQKINENNQKAEMDASLLQADTKARDGLRALDLSLEQNAPEMASLQSHFTKSSDAVPFLDALQKLAATAKASAQIDSVDTGTNNNGLTVGLTASGSFASVYKFLTLLENSPDELNFLSMDLHSLPIPAQPTSAKAPKIQIPQWEAVFKIQLLSFIKDGS